MFNSGYFAQRYFDEAYFSNAGVTPVFGSGGDMTLLGAG